MSKQIWEKKEMMTLTSDSLAERFLGRAVQISLFGAQIGINITPTSDPRMLIFRAMPHEEQVKAVQKIEQSCDIFSSIIRDQQSLGSSFSVVWKSLNFLGLRPPSDFFDKLTDEDVVQVYSIEGIHRFSNLKFFEMCSYTLEQIYSLPWEKLWNRPSEQALFLIDAAADIMMNHKSTVVYNMTPHRIYEVSSVFRYESLYSLKCGAPLFDRHTGERSGLIVCESAQILNKHTPQEEERMLFEFEAKNLPLQLSPV